MTLVASCSKMDAKVTENSEEVIEAQTTELLLAEQVTEMLPEIKYLKVESFMFPLPEKYRYYISSGQGLRDSIANVNVGGQASLSTYHNALDFAVPIRTPVYAAKDGYVINCYPGYDNGKQWKGHPSYGGCIEIRHSDGTRTLYAHLIRTDVKEGDFVKKGQLIGGTGGKRGMRASGNSTGPHLHFSIYLDIESAFE